MDFNDIQNAWNNEKTDNVVVPDNLEKIQSANMPLGKIRKNLRTELFGQILALIIIGFLPLYHEFPSRFVGPYYFIYGILNMKKHRTYHESITCVNQMCTVIYMHIRFAHVFMLYSLC